MAFYVRSETLRYLTVLMPGMYIHTYILCIIERRSCHALGVTDILVFLRSLSLSPFCRWAFLSRSIFSARNCTHTCICAYIYFTEVTWPVFRAAASISSFYKVTTNFRCVIANTCATKLCMHGCGWPHAPSTQAEETCREVKGRWTNQTWKKISI